MSLRMLISFIVLLTLVVTVRANDVYKYNVCNGLSHQLLYHSASIAIAAEHGKEVEIPDYFIVNGVQLTDDSVLPNKINSVPFGEAFDQEFFLRQVESLGVKEARFVTFDFSKTQIPCAEMHSLQHANPEIALKVLKAFRPSERLQKLISRVTEGLFQNQDSNEGVCLHHRNGKNWIDHCTRWESINDGIYRGNCLGVPGRKFLDSLEDRGLTGSRWLYYCGDNIVEGREIPRRLRKSRYPVFSRNDFIEKNDQDAVEAINGGQPVRDLWAVIDFFVCNGITHFIGNSVSLFSAIQVALRGGENAFWYNSQSIPLAGIWNAYHVPIVYTYTELSQQSGKYMLRASIKSVREHMPNSKIHILYDGTKDAAFRLWLQRNDVIIHNHDPAWRRQIEIMRQNGDPKRSHLFLHSGNYFGTWQRIDIPLFINSEYCLQLDADTIVARPFTLADFGLDLTYGIAMSAEIEPDMKASNAGVTLINVPHMRQTYHNFMEFILKHVNSAEFGHPSPSDQGAFLKFYKRRVRFLSRSFNFKPYWKSSDIQDKEPYIVHFHGPKPHDYIKKLMGERCNEALEPLCGRASRLPSLCSTMQIFARASKAVDQRAYCEASFADPAEAAFCNDILDELVKNSDACSDFVQVIRDVLVRFPDNLGLRKDVIERALNQRSRVWPLLWALGIGIVLAIAWRSRANRSSKGHDE